MQSRSPGRIRPGRSPRVADECVRGYVDNGFPLPLLVRFCAPKGRVLASLGMNDLQSKCLFKRIEITVAVQKLVA